MDKWEFYRLVGRGRKNLEDLLFSKESDYKRLKRSLSDLFIMFFDEGYYLSSSFIVNEKGSEEGKRSDGFRIKLEDLHNKYPGPNLKNVRSMGNLDFVLLPFLSRFSGNKQMISYHEIGELLYLFTLLNAYPKFGKRLSSRKLMASAETASDIYGDILVSTLSPISPEEELNLLSDNPKDIKKTNLSRRERSYILSHSIHVKEYLNRKKEGYLYSEELFEFYLQFLKMQIGFDKKQRREFQLFFYNVVQDRIWNKLEDSSINSNENFSNIFPDILFNSDELLMGLKRYIP